MTKQGDIELNKFNELMRRSYETDSGCFISHLAPNGKGYCYVTMGRQRRERAHRFVFEYMNGKLDEGLVVRHTCDIRNCINPEHLISGTIADNQRDMAERSRGSTSGKPATEDHLLQEALDMRLMGYTLQEIADWQNLAGPTSASDRVRRAKEKINE